MPLSRTAVPSPGATTISTHGRSYAPAQGVVTLAENDDALTALGANGWNLLPRSGTTAQRPVNARPGEPYIDTQLGSVVFALVFPAGSGIVRAWCDLAGNPA